MLKKKKSLALSFLFWEGWGNAFLPSLLPHTAVEPAWDAGSSYLRTLESE